MGFWAGISSLWILDLNLGIEIPIFVVAELDNGGGGGGRVGGEGGEARRRVGEITRGSSSWVSRGCLFE